jgi:hypothetical protein
MPRQPSRSTRPATTTKAGTTTTTTTTTRRPNGGNTGRKPNGNGNGRRNNRAAYWPIELSLATGIEVTVEGQDGDAFGIAVCSLCAAILPGSEVSQRLHTVWHDTIAEIAGSR